MAFLARYVTHPDFADTLSDAAHMVLGTYRVVVRSGRFK